MMCLCGTVSAGTPPRLSSGIEVRGLHPLSRPLVAFDAIERIIYCAGTFRDSVRIGPLRAYGSGMQDVFLAAFDMDLRPRWIQRMGGNGDDSVTCLATLPSGGVALGLMCGGLTLDVPTYSIGTTTFTGKGGYDAVVTSVTDAGDIRWTRADGAQSSEFPTAIVATNNDLYVCGTFVGLSRFGTTVVQDDGRTSAYVQCISSAGESRWVQWTRGVVGTSGQGRGRAEGGMACSVTNGTVRAAVQISSAIRWGDQTLESTSFTYETKAAVLTATADGVAVDAELLTPCRGDSCPAVLTDRASSALTTESLNCIAGNEVGIGFHHANGQGATVERRYPVGGARTAVLAAAAGGADMVLAAGRFERAFSFTTSQPRPDIFTENLFLQDGFLISVGMDGTGDWALALGATAWSTVTSCAMRGPTIVAAATIIGQLSTDAGPLGSSLSDTLGVIVLAESTVSNVPDQPWQETIDVPSDVTLPVLDVLGRHVATYLNATLSPASLPAGIYGVMVRNGMLRRIHVNKDGAVRIGD
ncbi:MAG: hypothetical protein JSS89_13630 [Bacteroidetes bacterium]|nr:hypothetical protein [Bacteroidota bacterium]